MADSISKRIERLEAQALPSSNERHEEILAEKARHPIDYPALEKAMRDMHFSRLADLSGDELIAWHAAELANTYPGTAVLAAWTAEFIAIRGL